MSERRLYTPTEIGEIQDSLNTLTGAKLPLLHVLGFISGFSEYMQGDGTGAVFNKCADDLEATFQIFTGALREIKDGGLLIYNMDMALQIVTVAFRLMKALRDYAWLYSDADLMLIQSLPDELLENLSSLQIVRNTQ